MTTTAEHLKQFYRELQAWIEAGCPEGSPFETCQPICDNLMDWECENDTNGVGELIREQFEAAGLHPHYPFDKSADIFGKDGVNHYENPARLAWIKAHAEEEE